MKNMEKKVYTTPECFVVELETVSMIASSINENSGGTITENEAEDMGANRHRGQWGNLWSN